MQEGLAAKHGLLRSWSRGARGRRESAFGSCPHGASEALHCGMAASVTPQTAGPQCWLHSDTTDTPSRHQRGSPPLCWTGERDCMREWNERGKKGADHRKYRKQPKNQLRGCLLYMFVNCHKHRTETERAHQSWKETCMLRTYDRSLRRDGDSWTPSVASQPRREEQSRCKSA